MIPNVSSSAEVNALTKKSAKQLGKEQQGNPDEWDYKNLQTIIDIYDKSHPGVLDHMETDYKVQYALSGRNKYGVISDASEHRLGMWMPADLEQVISAGYPSLWTNQKHLEWFLKKFPRFKGMEVL